MKTPAFFKRSELTATLWLFRREFFVCLIFTMVTNVLMLAPTLYMLQVFDRVLVSQSGVTLLALTLVMLFLFSVMAFAEWSRSRLLVRTGVKLDTHLDSRVFNASFAAHLGMLGANPTQPFADLTNIRQFLTGTGLFALLDAPWAPIYLAVLFLLHPVLGWLSIFFILLSIGLAYLSHRLTHQQIDKASAAEMEVTTYVQSKLKNADVIESMGMLGDLRWRWQGRHRRHLALQHKARDLSQRMQQLSKFLRFTQNSLALAVAALLVIKGELSMGGIIAANMLMNRATQPVDMVMSQWKSFLAARQSFVRLEALFAKHPQRDAGLAHPAPEGHLRIENLVASAPARGLPILKGLSANFPAGETAVIIGPSGSGKSTLARVLVGIWPDVSGQVTIDGEPIGSWDRAQLGPFLGYLPQDVEMFEGSIAENIARFGELKPEQVILASQHAGVHDMILRLPRGYDTAIGEAGRLLSGGQRQRIGLARALYGNPRVIVLDEPNANLDEAGEAALIKAVQDLKQQGKTIILISHRMNIIDVADRIVHLNDGVITYDGAAKEFISAQARRVAASVPSGGKATPLVQPA